MFPPLSREALWVQFFGIVLLAFNFHLIGREKSFSNTVFNLLIAADFFLVAVAIGYVFFRAWPVLPYIFTGLFIFLAIRLIVGLVNSGAEWPKEAPNRE